jgi:cellulose synthase/poly-beta-1,6-N-acetylglucosamine synthase-like glycosyltransferase
MMLWIGAFLYVILISAAWVMTFYTLNFHYLSYQSLHTLRHKKYTNKKDRTYNSTSLPAVTIQLPLYNEKYVAVRLIDSVCQIDYPKEKLQIQILDDSDDDTTEMIKVLVKDFKLKGFDISYIHRLNRSGYKAGALKVGMQYAKGEFIAIFDADFIPPSDFLKNALDSFADPKLGLVQCRWGHVNESYSTLTEAQAISLDLHFLVEQKAKSLSHLFMNFNGSAGVWRTLCIQDAGGWHASTLVEDLDLSYRAQLKGWKCLFLEDVVVAAELPVQMNAAKRQQFRWAKGSVQLALKLLPNVILHKKIPLDTKIQAFIQLTRHFVHTLFLTQFLIFPILLAYGYELYGVSWAPVIGILIYILTGPFSYLYMIRKIWKRKWKSKARQYIFLILFSVGISVNNTVAIFEALMNDKNEFLRTPKFGILRKEQGWKNKSYALPFTKTILLEIFFGLYGCIAIFISIFSRNPIFLPIIVIQTIGFIYIAYLGLLHSSKKSFSMRREVIVKPTLRKPEYNRKTISVRLVNKRSDMINTTVFDKTMRRNTSLRNRNGASNSNRRYYRLIVVGILAFIAFGAGIAYYGYQQTIYPIDKAVGFLSRAETSQTPEVLSIYVRLVQQLLPKQGNPVWSFSTPRTDFGLIQSDLAAMISRADSISSLGPHTSAYNTGLQDIHASIKVLETNLQDATPYLYVSFTNVILSVMWIAIIVLVFAIMNRSRARFIEYDERA